MTAHAELERRYRRWLWCYPGWFRREHEAEFLGVLLVGAREGQRRPEPRECLDLLVGGLSMVLRSRVARSDRAAVLALRLMYLGAVVELATVLAVLASMGEVRSATLAGDPGYTAAQWHAEVTHGLDPIVVGGAVAVGLWLWLAWANGRGQRWARVVFVLFFALNTCSLATGIGDDSAVYARVDLAAGITLWLVQLAAVICVVRQRSTVPGSGRTSPGKS
ncbi:MAG TPA: hypothetical protein VHW44_00910 [Pseudonocardiaceae bacterium]|jgi:hypothetical protein|nr:hypothetical protein [Pseudonocardiaceae bacterium]